MRVCAICGTKVEPRQYEEDCTVDYCPMCEQVVEGKESTINVAVCYFCGQQIKDKEGKAVRIVESPKDYQAGGIRVWVCTECEKRVQEEV